MVPCEPLCVFVLQMGPCSPHLVPRAPSLRQPGWHSPPTSYTLGPHLEGR